MSNKHDRSKEADALRAAAQVFGRNVPFEPTPTFAVLDDVGRELWRDLSRAAVKYARRVLDGQCIPKEP